MDVSLRSLERAIRGEYGSYSFREREPEFIELRDRYLRKNGLTWRVINEIRPGVEFQRANLIEPSFLQEEEPFHVIFCRNLFIYLDPNSRKRAITNLQRLLATDGVLFIGHTEAQLLAESDFRTCEPIYPFMFKRTQTSAPISANGLPLSELPPAIVPPALPSPRRPMSRPPVTPPAFERRPPAPAPGPPPALVPSPAAVELPEEDLSELLGAAQGLADTGKLDEAHVMCGRLVDRFPLSARVFGLRGLVRRALGKLEESTQDLERAVYLDPDHEESLTHLMQIRQLLGDDARAERIRRRLVRVLRRNEPRSS